MLKGNKSNVVDDHLDYFGLDENLNLFNKYADKILKGQSIPYDEIPANSRAGGNKAAIESTIQDIIKTGADKLNTAGLKD